MKRKILVTGSSGHSGHQISALLSHQYDIIGLDLIEGAYTTHLGSLTDHHLIDHLTDGIEAIIHTASLHAPHVQTHSRKDFVDTNITGTLKLLEAAQKNQVRKFIYTSTTSLYGESMVDENQAVWITEDIPTIPRDIYDITKIAAEGLCRDFFDKEGMQTTVLRVSRFWNEPLDMRIFYRMYRGVDVKDVADAHQLAIEKDFDAFNIFNISAQSIFTKNDLFDLKNNTRQLLEERIPALIAFYKSKDWFIPESIDRVYVIDKAKTVLGFDPKYNIHEMLKEY
ncbi:MAG: NAD(P)-dependent oxidoreductase [Chitinophagales bacterium]|nr:NAD(P)-dependent oxidoreductase [Chitinophagales bacterium]